MTTSRRAPDVRLTRVVRFAAGHRYHSDALSPEENRRVFGKCNYPHGHGHDYRVEVSVRGPVDPVTGMVVNLADLDALLREQVIEPLDHRFLNLDVEYFATRVPTCENLAVYLFERLAELLVDWPLRLERVRVFEGDDLSATVQGETP
jgi:6-pyruvoyltetrahydropterin/6-carboxytetrahydropterin synthase